MVFFLQKERIFSGVHKIGAAISGPRTADTNFTDTKRIFLKLSNSLSAVSNFLLVFVGSATLERKCVGAQSFALLCKVFAGYLRKKSLTQRTLPY